MPEQSLELFIAEVVDAHRPQDQPPFDSLELRWRRRRANRRWSAVAAVAIIAAAAVAVPAVLLDWAGGRNLPSATTDVPSPTHSRPIGLIPWEVTSVSACSGTDCHTITDPRQVGLLVDDLNASGPYPYEYYDSSYCETVPNFIALTFTGPREPYPVIDVMAKCDFWVVRGETLRYEGFGRIRDSAIQAQRLGVVVHDCGVTSRSSYNGPEFSATEFVGLSLDEAESRAAQHGMSIRLLGQDGTMYRGCDN